MFVRTERLFLRPSWPEDVDELRALLVEDATVGDLVITAHSDPVGAFPAYPASGQDSRLPQLIVNLRDDHDGAKLIGGVSLARSGADIELKYWIARRYRGHGFAAEAVTAVLAEARMLGHRQVIAASLVGSESSARVLERSGFKPTDEVRARFSRLRGATVPARLYVAVLADKLFDLLGVGPQRPAPA